MVVYPTNGAIDEYTVDTQYSKSGTIGVADLYEVSAGVLGLKISAWTTATAGMVQIDAVIKYHSYGESDFSSLPGMVYSAYDVV